jgi:hypothetical protein
MKGWIKRFACVAWLAIGLPTLLVLPLLIVFHVSINHDLLRLEYALLRAIRAIFLADPDPQTEDVPPVTQWGWCAMVLVASILTAVAVYSLRLPKGRTIAAERRQNRNPSDLSEGTGPPAV